MVYVFLFIPFLSQHVAALASLILCSVYVHVNIHDIWFLLLRPFAAQSFSVLVLLTEPGAFDHYCRCEFKSSLVWFPLQPHVGSSFKGSLCVSAGTVRLPSTVMLVA